MIMKLYRFHLKFARPTPTVSSIAITVYSTRDLPMQPKNAAATAASGSGSARQRQLPCAAAAAAAAVVAAAAAAVRCRWSLPLQAATAAAAADGSAVCFFMGSHLFGRLGQKRIRCGCSGPKQPQWAEAAPQYKSAHGAEATPITKRRLNVKTRRSV